MRRVPRGWRCPLKVKPFAESSERSASGARERSGLSRSGLWCQRHLQVVCCDDGDSGNFPRGGFLPNHDLDVLVERRQEVHQTFDGEACQLVVTKRRDLGLRDSQHLGGIGLRDLARFKLLIQRIRQAQLGLTLGTIGKPEICEHVSGPTGDRFFPFSAFACHSVPRDPSQRFSTAPRSDRHPVWPSGCRTETSSGTRAGRTRLSRTEPCTPLDTRFRRATRRP